MDHNENNNNLETVSVNVEVTTTTASAEAVQDPKSIERAMRRKRRKRKQMIARIINISIIAMVVVGLILGAYFIFFHEEDTYSEYDAKLDKLAYKKQQLLSELDRLGPDMIKKLGNTSYMSFIFTGLDAAIYTSAHPIMAEGDNDLVGILAFSPEELPGLDGKITRKHFDTLMLLDWGTAIYWNGEGDLDEYLTTMKGLLDGLQINFPETIYFKAKTYSPDYDETVLAHGIKNVIHAGDGGLSIRVDGEPGDVWKVGYVGWQAGMSATLLKRSVESEGGYAFLAINFVANEENSAYSYFVLEGEDENKRIDSFRKMVNLFKTSIRSGSIEVLSTEAVRAKVTKYYSERTVIELEYDQRRKDINAELAEIERQMTALYAEYH